MDQKVIAAGSAKATDDNSIASLDAKPKKKRSSRWAGEDERMAIPGVPVALAAKMTNEQQKLYLIQLKIEEIGLKLRSGCFDLIVKKADRSPSPDPVYDENGLRLNTRDLRMRQKLENERHELIRQALELYPDYQPPVDVALGSNSKLQEKVFIPQDVHPNINFIGMIIGPRGNSLRKLELDTGCKIIIRGKGSTRENKVRTEPLPGEDEPLHALITANCEDNLLKGITQIQDIISEGLANPEGDNELRKSQLRELAVLNGTVQASEFSRCKNCGSSEHRHWECQVASNVVVVTICERCGGGGHVTSDCTFEGERAATAEERSKIDDAYTELMKELGVKNNETEKNQKDNIPSILAMPKAMVSQLPWASSVAGCVSGPARAAMPLVSSNQFANNDIYSKIPVQGDVYQTGVNNLPTNDLQSCQLIQSEFQFSGGRHIIQVGPNQPPSMPLRHMNIQRIQQPNLNQYIGMPNNMPSIFHQQTMHPNAQLINRVPSMAQYNYINQGVPMGKKYGGPNVDIFGRTPPPMPPKYRQAVLNNQYQTANFYAQRPIAPQMHNPVNELLPWASSNDNMAAPIQVPYNLAPMYQNYQMNYPGTYQHNMPNNYPYSENR